ncbi:sensor histidine kinase [Dyella amyloliquefaciens]|uniref:sensor histidine kinase n=1 Tax=Dyella amyloliquefaciens TaxID=1770545 RepID=UPI00102E48D7|nr:sensor histidine kinase [Dyella amyloliquefaciens]
MRDDHGPGEANAVRNYLRAWFTPAPDSMVAHSIRKGKSPWVDAVHLLWSVWVFLTPVFDRFSLRWVVLTLISYPIFLLLYSRCCFAPRRTVYLYSLALVGMSYLLMPWYPSGLTYFMYGCVMLCSRRMSLRAYMAIIAGLNVVILVEAYLLHYPWQAIVWMPLCSFIVGLAVNAERMSEEKEVELRLSHEEVRRLAATAERERIGRDLHDLLGHTLSLITLKLELSRKLFDRDSEAARREMEEAERVARHALAEVRAAVTGIRATDLAAELASARLLLESSDVALDYGNLPPSLPADLERSLALVLREAVTNIARHARASRASVAIEVIGETLQLRVDDNGRGGIGVHGNGLCGMHERVRALGGQLQVDSPLGQGTRLCISVPLRPRGRMFDLPGESNSAAAPWVEKERHAT